MSPALDWLPWEQRLRSAVWRGETHMLQGEFFAAYRAFLQGARAAEGEDVEFARGLVHLAAAGYKRVCGDERGAARQLAHARRRLEPFRPGRHSVDLEGLLALSERGS